MPQFTIAQEKREHLCVEGFVMLASGVPPDLLGRLRQMADVLEARALAEHSAGRHSAHAAVFDGPKGPVVERLDKILEADAQTLLDLLACPAMMAIARELCGHGAVPIEMDLLFKQPHPNGYVIWHQGAQHSRRWPYLNVGIYLDDAPIDDGCLRYVPRTQAEKQDICSLAEHHGWDIPGSIDVPASAGDILVQDMMVLHCSPPKRSSGSRRTVYVEIRPAQAIVEDRSQSAEWAQLRRRWMAMVVSRAGADDWPADWCMELPETGHIDAEVMAIADKWEAPLPAHYCHRPFEHPDYPVPADLRGEGPAPDDRARDE